MLIITNSEDDYVSKTANLNYQYIDGSGAGGDGTHRSLRCLMNAQRGTIEGTHTLAHTPTGPLTMRPVIGDRAWLAWIAAKAAWRASIAQPTATAKVAAFCCLGRRDTIAVCVCLTLRRHQHCLPSILICLLCGWGRWQMTQSFAGKSARTVLCTISNKNAPFLDDDDDGQQGTGHLQQPLQLHCTLQKHTNTNWCWFLPS